MKREGHARRGSRAGRLEFSPLYVDKELGARPGEKGSASTPARAFADTPQVRAGEHAGELRKATLAAAHPALTALDDHGADGRPPLLEPASSADCVASAESREERRRGESVALQDVTLGARDLWHHVQIQQSERPPLDESAEQQAARQLACRNKEVETVNKRWLFCGFVWIRTGKPRPRSVFGIQWCRGLLFVDGIGVVYYISERHGGRTVCVCNRGRIRTFSLNEARYQSTSCNVTA